MTGVDVPMFDHGSEPDVGELIDRVSGQVDDAHQGAVPRAVLLATSAPGTAARRLAHVEALLAATDEGDVGWEAEVAALTAALTTVGRCRSCGRTLTDPDSVRAGIGPECARKDDTP